MRIKICGLTRTQDIEVINRHHPDFAGFIFAESRRKLLPDEAKELIRLLSSNIVPVGVFVDAAPEGVAETATFCGLRVIQLHGGEDESYIHHLRDLIPPDVQIWKALRIRSAESLQPMVALPADRFLLDSWHPDQAGGTGEIFDWTLLPDTRKKVGENGFILAGGLTVENVIEAVRRVRPWCVDVSSGVEIDGVKDEGKIGLFVEAARRARAADTSD